MNKLWVGGVMLLLICCSSTAVEPVGKQPANSPSSVGSMVLVYRCDNNQHFVVERRANSAFIFFANLNRTLPAQGNNKYGDEHVQLDLGASVTLTTPTITINNCANDARAAIWEKAKLSGVDFRAVGNEPGWVMEIKGQQANLRLDYGKRIIDVELPAPSIDKDKKLSIFKSPEFEISIEGQRCKDTMSGEAFEASVNIKINGKAYRGCGRALH